MERKAAAEFLGVSVSTLDRIASQGRLKRGRAKGKTRPRTVFDDQELAVVKKELSRAQPTAPPVEAAPPKPRDTVGFRLDPHYAQRLAEEGGRHGMSAGEYARKLVIQGLEDGRADLFRGEVRALREGLADAFHAFLTLKCDVDGEEATEFVNDTILRGNERA